MSPAKVIQDHQMSEAFFMEFLQIHYAAIPTGCTHSPE